MRVTITYRDVPLVVECVYTPGTPNRWEEPGDPEELEIETICVGDVDISGIIGATAADEIDQLVIVAARKQCKDDADEARAEQRQAAFDCFRDAGCAAFGARS